jgi:hypothetical protein
MFLLVRVSLKAPLLLKSYYFSIKTLIKKPFPGLGMVAQTVVLSTRKVWVGGWWPQAKTGDPVQK